MPYTFGDVLRIINRTMKPRVANQLFRAGTGLSLLCLIVGGAAHAQPATPAEGPTFNRDILPILQEHCQPCHRAGQVAPMSLVTYEEVRPWAKSIQKEVAARSMPPFHAAGPIGRYLEDWRLTDEQVDLVVRWVSGGARRGNEDDAPPPEEWKDTGWQSGEPDLVITFDEVQVDGTGKDGLAILFSDYAFPSDTWIRSIEYRPSSRKHVHHAGLFAVPDANQESEEHSDPDFNSATFLEEVGKHLLTWLPGQNPLSFPKDQGVKIEKGNRIGLQVHFAPSSEPFMEQSEVGLGLVDGLMRYETRNQGITPEGLEIPPGDPNYELRFKRIPTFNVVTVQAFRAHMHLRGKSCKVNLLYADGSSETVFELPKYDFDWQRWYVFSEPLMIPVGTEIEYVFVWDNSEANPLNPDPTKTVTWGWKTTDEMIGMAMQTRKKLKEPLQIKHGVEVQP